MKRIISLVFSLGLLISVFGQTQYEGIFSGKVRTTPQVHADGIFRFFIQSDNQMRYGNTERAILLLDNAIAQNPFYAEVYLKRAELLSRIGRFDEARTDRLTAHRLNPYMSSFLSAQKLGRLQYLAFDQAQIETYAEAMNDDKTGLTLKSSVQKKLDGNLHEAIYDLKQVIEEVKEPEAELYNMKGSLYLLMDDYKNAINYYTEAIELEPQGAAYYFNRGVAQLFTYDRVAACEDLKLSKQLGYERSEEKLKNFCFY